MQFSNYQLGVFEHWKKRAGNSAVISVAGSGKTFTAIEGIGHIPPFYTVLLGAFNKDIQVDFQEKGSRKGYKHARYTTYNAFGWQICMKSMQKKPILDRDKTSKILEFEVMCPSDENTYKQFHQYRYGIVRLVSLFKNLNIHTLEEAAARYDDIVSYFNLDVPDETVFQTYLFETFMKSIEQLHVMDFDDQKYMPIHMGWNIPCYDQVIVDEFQDTCPVEMALMSQAVKGGQFSAIGDPDQSIYGFKGALPDAFDKYIGDFNAKVLPLSICYRCPRSVVAEAQKIVPRIEAAPEAKEGSVDTVETKNFLCEVQARDFVLCRTTEPLIRRCLQFIRQGRSAKVRGRDLGDNLIYVIDSVARQKDHMSVDKFMPELLAYQSKRIAQLKRSRRESDIQGVEDRVESIIALAEECSTVLNIKQKINLIFCDDKAKHTGIDIMSCHKSKGLQAKNVWVLRPDLLPHPRSQDRDWMLHQEKCLKYVAITRSEENFRWVNKEPGEK